MTQEGEMGNGTDIEAFIAQWRDTGGSELANTQSFINGLCALIGVAPPDGSRTDDAYNDYVFERRVFQDNGDGTYSFGRLDAYKRGAFILEAKQGSDADRAAATRGEDDLDLFGQTATARMKRGTARRGTPGWAKAMVQAKGQAERYAKALPVDHGWPPFLLIADIGYCIEVYADFTGTGKAYTQFPDRSRYRIMLDDLRDADVRKRLAAIWTAPKTLDPSTEAARVTREIADLLATVSRRLEGRGHSADAVSGFLMRVLFTMFAEDTGVLLPKDSFKALLRAQLDHPQHLHHQLSALWGAMDRGEFAPALGVPVKRFNGYLFKDTAAIPLEADELRVLIAAAEKDWTEVEPAIFGTLLERALNPKERAKLGAHYTPRAYVERLVGPTILEPLRADWAGVRVAAAELIDQGEIDDARRTVETFHGQLAATRVLDPACGTGNFLYVAMARMKELEGEVLDLLVDLGDDQYVAELTGHTITPDNFLGIEINPRAAAIAQLVLWIGYLQWHFRVNGKDRVPPEPILRDIRTIENRDALIAYDAMVLERDDGGAPVTRWDGETTKPHPVTGRPVPDEAASVEVYRYVNPRAAAWPKADFIVGNPPFIGNKRMPDRLGKSYVEALRKISDRACAKADFVMFWWMRAACEVVERSAHAFGFVTTNSIKQSENRSVVERALSLDRSFNIEFAVVDHPWVDSDDGAAVRISMTMCSRNDAHTGKLFTVMQEERSEEGAFQVVLASKLGHINADLSVGANVASSSALEANRSLSAMGVILCGDGFFVDSSEAATVLEEAKMAGVARRYASGIDLAQHARDRWVIDFTGFSDKEARKVSPSAFQWILARVEPERRTNAMPRRREKWWLFGSNAPVMRSATSELQRYIATARTAKHRVFQFVAGDILVESNVVAIASDDPWTLGVLSSKFHLIWAGRAGATLEDRPHYTNSTVFDPFPFPVDTSELLKAGIRSEAEALDALRKHVLVEHADLTFTKLYNVLEALRAGRPLTAPERDIHDRGLVTLIRQHHDAIDDGVADAYGWGEEHRAGKLDDDMVLTRLVALNEVRVAEEARGLIRYLRPEFQDPGYRAPISGMLDLGEASALPVSNVIPWPLTLPEQVSAVQAILASAPAPMAPHDIARAFKGKRAATVRPVLDALAGIGMARRLADGRYAA